MKKIFYTITALVLIWVFLTQVTGFDKRNAEYNKYMCATTGYKEDCKTPLSDAERLK